MVHLPGLLLEEHRQEAGAHYHLEGEVVAHREAEEAERCLEAEGHSPRYRGVSKFNRVLYRPQESEGNLDAV